MAETAGPVIGGVALAYLTDPCFNLIRHVHTGKGATEDNQTAALILALLGVRLNVWEQAFEKSGAKLGTPEVGNSAEKALTRIKELLQSAEDVGQQYTTLPQNTRSSEEIEMATSRVLAKLPIRGKKESSWPGKMVSALSAQPQPQSMASEIKGLVESLERIAGQLVPLHHASAWEAMAAEVYLAMAEALKDQNVQATAFNVFPSHCPYQWNAPSCGGSMAEYIGNKAGKNARVIQGAHVAQGFVGHVPISRQLHRQNEASDNARAQYGDQYGGKGIFDD